MTLRVLLADDHPVVREGLRALLASEADFEVVGEAEGGEEVPALVEGLHPHVVVLDLMMPGRGGLHVIRELNLRWPDTRVLMLSMHDDETYVLEALHSGAFGYALKRPRRRSWCGPPARWAPAADT